MATPHGSIPTTAIAPGVNMPMLNFGLQKDHSAAIKLGVRGIDTAEVCMPWHVSIASMSHPPSLH